MSLVARGWVAMIIVVPVQQIVREHGGLIMYRIASAIKECYVTSLKKAGQAFDNRFIGVKFCAIALLKFVPARRVMTKPFTQCRGWCDIFEP